MYANEYYYKTVCGGSSRSSRTSYVNTREILAIIRIVFMGQVKFARRLNLQGKYLVSILGTRILALNVHVVFVVRVEA